MKIKKALAIILAMMMLFTQIVPVCAEETNSDEWYELVEEDFEFVTEPDQSISPYSMYIMKILIKIL